MALSPAVMGIVNATPDSFFPASRTAQAEEAIARGLAYFAEGADYVDVGGESTRPGAAPVDEGEERSRVVRVIEALARVGPVSVDTQKASVARAAVEAGARIVNDVSGTLAEVAGSFGVGYVAMHRQGEPATMQERPHYDDVVGEVGAFLRDLARRAREAGVRELWLDPGIGFGKTVQHNLALLANADRFVDLAKEFGAGLLIGVSRKSFLGALGDRPLGVDERLESSLAVEAWAMVQGADVVRVHDVRATVQLRELFARPLEEAVPT